MKIKALVYTIKTALQPLPKQQPTAPNRGLAVRTNLRAGFAAPPFSELDPETQKLIQEALAKNGTLFTP